MITLELGIGIAILLAVLISIAINYRKRSQIKKELIIKINEAASQHGLSIQEFVQTGEVVLGIDTVKKHAFYLDLGTSEDGVQTVDLTTVKSCRLNRETRTVDEESFLVRIELVFATAKAQDENVVFPIFDEEKDALLNDQLIVGNQWVKKYNEITGK